jgi:hypothetical protein
VSDAIGTTSPDGAKAQILFNMLHVRALSWLTVLND